MFTAHEILDMAIRLEENGESVYRDAAAQTTDPDIRALLLWMAEEEVKHARWFSDLKKKIKTRSSNPFMEEMSRKVFGSLLGEKSFSHREVNLAAVDRIDDLIAVFKEFEKDTVLFYETLIPFIEDNHTLINIEKIISEEKNHITKLNEVLANQTELPVTDN